MPRPRNRLLTFAFGLALVLVLAFGVRVATGWLGWRGQSDPPLADWMPMGYVARSWDIPREVLAEALGIPPGSAPRRTLAQIAADRGETPEALIARIEAAIAAHRAAAPAPE